MHTDQVVYVAVIQETQLVLVRNGLGMWTLPYFHQASTTPWSVHPYITAWNYFGWSVDIIRRPELVELSTPETQVLCAVCQFDADHKSSGSVSERQLLRIIPSLYPPNSTERFDPIVDIVVGKKILNPKSEIERSVNISH